VAEIDLAVIGERASAGANGTPDQRTFERRPDQESAKRPDTGTDPAAADGAVSGAVATRAQGEDGDR